MAIACLLGLETVRVRVFSWRELFRKRRVHPILEEARVKREAQKHYLGKRVARLSDGRELGRVVLVSARTVARPVWAPWRAHRVVPLLLIERPDGTLASMEVGCLLFLDDDGSPQS